MHPNASTLPGPPISSQGSGRRVAVIRAMSSSKSAAECCFGVFTTLGHAHHACAKQWRPNRQDYQQRSEAVAHRLSLRCHRGKNRKDCKRKNNEPTNQVSSHRRHSSFCPPFILHAHEVEPQRQVGPRLPTV